MVSEKSSNPKTIAHAKIFYCQILFVISTFILGSRALLTPYIIFFAWLPALLLMFDATLALASLMYLDFTKERAAHYIRLTLSLVIFRFSCAFVLGAELFLPHSEPTISVPLILVAFVHCSFSCLSSVRVHNLSTPCRDSGETKIYSLEEESIKLGSMTTLVTNIDEF